MNKLVYSYLVIIKIECTKEADWNPFISELFCLVIYLIFGRIVGSAHTTILTFLVRIGKVGSKEASWHIQGVFRNILLIPI